MSELEIPYVTHRELRDFTVRLPIDPSRYDEMSVQDEFEGILERSHLRPASHSDEMDQAVRRIVSDVARLQAIHSRAVDINPENILVSASPRAVRLHDFSASSNEPQAPAELESRSPMTSPEAAPLALTRSAFVATIVAAAFLSVGITLAVVGSFPFIETAFLILAGLGLLASTAGFVFGRVGE